MANIVPPYTTKPPPAYADDSGILPRPLESITTLSGKLHIIQSLEIVNFNSHSIENRKVKIRDEESNAQVYLLTFQTYAASYEISSMELHRGGVVGVCDAKITFPPVDGVLAAIAINGRKIMIMEQKSKPDGGSASSSTGIISTFAVGDLTWRSSSQYLHPAKGTSKAGDLELVTPAGDILAVFLNSWSGSPGAKVLGRLCLTKEATDTALAIVSVIIVATHLSWRTRDGVKGFFTELMHGGFLLCHIM